MTRTYKIAIAGMAVALLASAPIGGAIGLSHMYSIWLDDQDIAVLLSLFTGMIGGFLGFTWAMLYMTSNRVTEWIRS